jgi:mutator protein MutT
MTTLVAAAVIRRDGRWLVTRRQRGVHLEGFWEFPGGKCHPGESLEICLARELREELAVGSVVGAEVFATRHAYPEHTVELHFFECRLEGNPQPQVGQEMRWVSAGELTGLEFPAADVRLIEWLTRTEAP